jgi:hypothetical protein
MGTARRLDQFQSLGSLIRIHMPIRLWFRIGSPRQAAAPHQLACHLAHFGNISVSPENKSNMCRDDIAQAVAGPLRIQTIFMPGVGSLYLQRANGYCLTDGNIACTLLNLRRRKISATRAAMIGISLPNRRSERRSM